MIYLIYFVYAMIVFIFKIFSKLLVILTALVSILIIYPIGVIVPFIWNFTRNPKGWIFKEMKCEDTAIIVMLRGKDDDDKWYFYGEYYPTFIHFLLACFLNNHKLFTTKHYTKLKDKNGNNIGLAVTDAKGNTVIDIETSNGLK